MSEFKVPRTKANKTTTVAKTTKVTKKQEQLPVPEVTPVVEQPVVATPVVVADEVADVVSKKQRIKVNEQLNTHISAARVRRDIDGNNLNRLNEETAAELKESVSEYVNNVKKLEDETTSDADKKLASEFIAANKAKYEVVEQQLKALSKDRIRFSNDASMIIALLCNEFIRELALFAMETTIALGKKNVPVERLFEPEVEKLSLFALVRNLPSYVKASEKFKADQLAAKLAADNKKAFTQYERDFKKKYNVHLTKEQKGKDKLAKAEKSKEEVPVEEEDDVTADLANEDTTYKYYICHLFTCNKPVASLRVSKEIKIFASKLVDEFLDSLSNQIRLTVINMKNKTVNEKAILHTIKSMLIMGHKPVESLEFKLVENKYEVVHTRKYPSSGYAEVKESILERVVKFKELHAKTEEVVAV